MLNPLKRHFLSLLLVLATSAALVSCSSNTSEVHPFTPEIREVYVPNAGLEPALRLTDKTDPKAVMRFAAGLAQAGQFSDAAEQYMSLAQGKYGPQPEDETAYLLAMEAARLYFIAGRQAASPEDAVNFVNKISECTQLARNAVDISERVITREEAMILYLGDIAAGRQAQNYWSKVPHQLLSWIDSAQNQIGG